MRRSSLVYAALGLALGLTGGAASTPVDPAYNPYVTIDYLESLGAGEGPGAQAAGRAVIRTADYLEQARRGKLARLEFEVRAEALQTALAGAHSQRRRLRLTLEAPGVEVKISEAWISSFQSGPAQGVRVAVDFLPSKLALAEGRGPASQRAPALQAVGRGPVPGGRPDPGGPDQNLALPAPLPDLRIRQAQQKPGDPQTLQVLVVNVGPGAAAATQVKVLYHRSGQVVTAQGAVPALAGGQDASVDVKLPGHFAGAEHLTARVDDPNVVPESNELNNGFVIVE